MKLNHINNRLGDFQHEIENILDHFLGASREESGCYVGTPVTNIQESETEFRLEMELAGVDPADVNIEMMEGKLEVSGEKKLAEAEDVKVWRAERRTGEFKRVFDFKSRVDADQIRAEFKNGLLTVVLPKPEKVLPKRIEINSAD